MKKARFVCEEGSYPWLKRGAKRKSGCNKPSNDDLWFNRSSDSSWNNTSTSVNSHCNKLSKFEKVRTSPCRQTVWHFLNHISFNGLILVPLMMARDQEVESRNECRGEEEEVGRFRSGFFRKNWNRIDTGGSPYSRSSSEVCAKFVAHRLERFQVKGYATPQPEYRDALVHAEIIFPRRPFVGTNC